MHRLSLLPESGNDLWEFSRRPLCAPAPRPGRAPGRLGNNLPGARCYSSTNAPLNFTFRSGKGRGPRGPSRPPMDYREIEERHGSAGASPSAGGLGGHVVPPTSLIPEAGGEVALAEVVEDRDESAPSDALCDAFDTGHIGPGRLTDEEARRRQPHAHPVRLVDSDRDALVDHFLVQDRRHDVLGAPQWLQSLDAGESLRNDADEADRGVVLLEAPPEAGQGAPRADADDDVGQPATGLLQDLGGRRLVVGPPVVRVAVLVAEEVTARVGLPAAANLPERLVVTPGRPREA